MPFDTPSAGTPEKKSALKNPLVYSSIIIAVIAVYVGYILISRYESNRQYAEQVAAKQAAAQRESDRSAVDQLGGSDVAIRSMLISPGVIKRGQSAQLCYDVSNAKTVTLDPPVAEVWPSHSRCFDISPKKTTTYTLTIKGATGDPVTQAVELKVE